MAVLLTDRLDQPTSCTEERGVITSLTRECRVGQLTNGDWSILAEAFTYLDNNGYAPGDSLSGYPHLVLYNRSASITPGQKTAVDVTLEYAAIGRDGYAEQIYYQGQGAPSTGALFTWRIGTSLSQIETQNDAYGNPITVTYAGDTQGGEVSAMEPQTVLQATGPIQVAYPDYITASWVGYMNADTWAGRAPYTWLCTRCDANPLDLGAVPPIWEFTFEFQHDRNTWLPQVWYKNSDGTVPSDLVAGTGAKTVDWYPAFAFSPYFPI